MNDSPAPSPVGTNRDDRDDSPRTRLAVVLDAALPWNQGGKEQRHHELATRLAGRGFEVTVYTMNWWDGPRRIRRDGITYVALCRHRPLYVGERRSVVQALVFALSCLKLVRHRFDVVEADAIPFLPLLPVRLVCWLRRRPMVTTWHEFWGRDYWVEYLGPAGRVAALVEAGTARLPDVVVAASEGTGSRLRASRWPPRRVVVVPNGVPDLEDGPVPRSVPGWDGGTLDLLYAGRLLTHKRVDVAVAAVARLRAAGTDARLEVVGAGPAREALEQQAHAAGVGDAVTFTAFLPEHRDVVARMAAADVVLLPSEREGFGMVVVEAMSVGTPVVTSDHADNFARFLVRPGVNGALAPSHADGLAEAVLAVARSRGDLVAGALATAAEHDWQSLSELVYSVYADVSRHVGTAGGSSDARP